MKSTVKENDAVLETKHLFKLKTEEGVIVVTNKRKSMACVVVTSNLKHYPLGYIYNMRIECYVPFIGKISLEES